MSNDFRIGARGNVYQLRNFNLEVAAQGRPPRYPKQSAVSQNMAFTYSHLEKWRKL
ncbi:hypothetical protein PCANC_05229 [Puccinia coronata f. sp. avenae]|uniref:Uncharacterized protein n=1 Tax=Puccinia coronata f. sp. avenae TaxID=200324 RepID=A0A2N5VW95_9BASI|nr:hypothetical protein PCANC_05229 [Puccinia coronata f. sp. avenae]